MSVVLRSEVSFDPSAPVFVLDVLERLLQDPHHFRPAESLVAPALSVTARHFGWGLLVRPAPAAAGMAAPAHESEAHAVEAHAATFVVPATETPAAT